MATDEFQLPEFLQHQSPEEIHERMLENLPTDIDKSEGSHPYNLTYPTAYEKSLMAEHIVARAIELTFPQFAYGDALDYHAEMHNLKRRAAQYATGTLKITGTAGVVIPAGTVFSTEKVNNDPSADFSTDEDTVISSDGTVVVGITAVNAGEFGNVPANTICLKANGIDGIASITNLDKTSGGIEEEDDESLRARILESCRTQGESFIGNPGDYKRWALSVPGVGEVTVVSAQDHTGLVTIVITNATGNPASEALCQEVYDYIMKPDDAGNRLAPINAYLSVIPPKTTTVTISVVIETDGTVALQQIKADLLQELKLYFRSAIDELEIKYSRIGSIISRQSGVSDYKNLLLNGSTSNVSIQQDTFPVIEEDDLMIAAGQVAGQ